VPVVEINRPNRSEPRRYTSSDVKRIVRYARKTESDADMRVGLLKASSELFNFPVLIDSLDIAIGLLEKAEKIIGMVTSVISLVVAAINYVSGLKLIGVFLRRLLVIVEVLEVIEEKMTTNTELALKTLKSARKLLGSISSGNITGVQTEETGAGS